VLDLIGPPYMQRAALEVLLLAVPGGLLGSWVVLRRLAFFTHAAGTATLPGLVVAGAWGVAPPLAGLASAGAFAVGVEGLGRRGRLGTDAATGLLLTAAVALGVVLASDVYESGAGLDRLLFGSLLAVSWSDVVWTAVVAAGVVAADAALRRAWLARGFDPDAATALGVPGAWADRALLLVIAAAVVISLDAVGALLVAAVFVVPAATVRLVARSLRELRWGAVALSAAEGLAAVLLARALNVGPGAVLATLAGLVFALVAVVARRRAA
jgi:manganese/iron transport system permease protein